MTMQSFLEMTCYLVTVHSFEFLLLIVIFGLNTVRRFACFQTLRLPLYQMVRPPSMLVRDPVMSTEQSESIISVIVNV
jgi:hypothetical protein